MDPEKTLDLLTMLPAPPFIATLEHLRIDLGYKTQDEVFKLVKECKQRHAVHIVISTKNSERFVRVDVQEWPKVKALADQYSDQIDPIWERVCKR